MNEIRSQRHGFDWEAFEARRRRIERTGMLIRAGVVIIFIAAILFIATEGVIAFHFIKKFW